LHVLLAFGGSSAFTQHESFSASNAKVDIAASSGDLQGSTQTKATDGTIAHGIVMVLAWLAFSPMGTFIARYLKGSDQWFPLHRGLQVTAVLFLVIGFIIIQVENPTEFGTHGALGIAVFAFALFQVSRQWWLQREETEVRRRVTRG
jgi:hypothetical protein